MKNLSLLILLMVLTMLTGCRSNDRNANPLVQPPASVGGVIDATVGLEPARYHITAGTVVIIDQSGEQTQNASKPITDSIKPNTNLSLPGGL